MNIVINPNPAKADTVEIQRQGQGFRVIVLKDNVVVNSYPADSEGMAIGIARKQMERLS